MLDYMDMSPEVQPFRHEALLYAGDQEFVSETVPLLEEALHRDEPFMVAVGPDKVELLRERLDGPADRIHFVDMRAAGTNPGAIISVWREFVDEHARPGRRLWGIGEPVWPERSADELGECHRHECLLNVAFADAAGFRLVCPYDLETLPAEVIDHARESHPAVVSGGAVQTSERYGAVDRLDHLLGEPLPEPAAPVDELRFTQPTLPVLRRFVLAHAARAGLPAERAEDAVLAINELATNSVCHGGGTGLLRFWLDGGNAVWEVRDGGWITDPLVGRQRPEPGRMGGFGLWMVNQLCELVQVRSSAGGTAVRLHVRRG